MKTLLWSIVILSCFQAALVLALFAPRLWQDLGKKGFAVKTDRRGAGRERTAMAMAMALDDVALEEPTSGLSILHVTKEFGPATMGGLGTMVDALVRAQGRLGGSEDVVVSVVIPYYSYLDLETVTVARMAVPLADGPVNLKVSAMALENVTLYLIGPCSSTRAPFRSLFRAKDKGDIYSAYAPLPQEWKELLWTKAVAHFVQAQGHECSDDIRFFVARPRFHILHLHGATNALVLYFLGAFGQPASSSPATVYTLHDYLDEVEYSNALKNVKYFSKGTSTGLEPVYHLHGQIIQSRVYPSAYAIAESDLATFVSRSVARDLVDGSFGAFWMEETVIGPILAKARARLWFGVSNGVDVRGTINPWDDASLHESGLHFPSLTSDMQLARDPLHTITAFKRLAKKVLVAKGLLASEDVAVYLFIGRFQYNKGCQLFRPLVEYLAKPSEGGTMAQNLFVAMGTSNNFPIAQLERLAAEFPQHFRLVSTAMEQEESGIFWRAAADFAVVPSFKESFGLVAAEGLLFGSTVISSGSGGLKEFLCEGQNAHLFDIGLGREDTPRRGRDKLGEMEPRVVESLVRAVDRAQKGRQGLTANEHEALLRSLVDSALSLSWDRPGGPTRDYFKLYRLAIEAKQRKAREIAPLTIG